MAWLGATLRVLPGTVPGVDRTLPWDELAALRLDPPRDPWFAKYVAFIETCAALCRTVPGEPRALIGPSDIAALLRGHTQSVLDLLETPDRMRRLLGPAATFSARLPKRRGSTSPCITAGTTTPSTSFGRQAPSSACKRCLRRALSQAVPGVSPAGGSGGGGSFPNAFIHLHSNSMFLYNLFLEVEELRCFQVNYELLSGGPPIAGMIGHFRRIQAAGRCLLVRGSFTPDQLRVIMDSLDPRVISLRHGRLAGRGGDLAARAGNVALCRQVQRGGACSPCRDLGIRPASFCGAIFPF